MTTVTSQPVSQQRGSLSKVMEFFGFYDESEPLENMASKAQQPVSSPSYALPSIGYAKNLLKRRTSDLQSITTLSPTSYKEATYITNSLKNNVPVILNVHLMSKAEALRIVDFCAGAVQALDGSIKRVTENVFIVAPYGVSLSDSYEENPSEQH